jgi:hypothetical protein
LTSMLIRRGGARTLRMHPCSACGDCVWHTYTRKCAAGRACYCWSSAAGVRQSCISASTLLF